MLAYRQADYNAARNYFQETLQLEERGNRATGIANSLDDLGNVACMKSGLHPGARTVPLQLTD